MNKTHEFQVDNHQVFVDYKETIIRPTRECLPRIMSEFGIRRRKSICIRQDKIHEGNIPILQ